MKPKNIVAILIGALIVIFSVQNIEIIEVEFLFWTVSSSIVLVILGSFSIGVLVGYLFTRKKRLFPNEEKKQFKA